MNKRYKARITNPVPIAAMSAAAVCVLWAAGAHGFQWMLAFVPGAAALLFTKHLENQINGQEEKRI